MARFVLVIPLLLVACATEPLDVGSTAPGAIDTGAPVDPPPGPPLPVWPERGVCAAAGQGDLVSEWDGAFEGDNFAPILPLRVEILAATETSGLCGVVHFGDGSPPPPASDPGADYPALFYSTGWGGFYPGASYAVLNGGLHADIVRFEINSAELLKDWCALQEPIYEPARDAWNCVPGTGFSYDGKGGCRFSGSATDETQHFTQAQCAACNAPLGRCVCNQDGCTAIVDGQYADHLSFDLERTGDELFGSVAEFGGLTVDLMRAP